VGLPRGHADHPSPPVAHPVAPPTPHVIPGDPLLSRLAGNTSATVSSNGQVVLPSLTFSASPSSITFANLNVGNSYTDTKTVTLTTSTNAYSGYVVRQFVSGALSFGAKTIGNFIGTYAAPATWSRTGFGCTSSDTSIQGSGDLFASATKYAALSTTPPGDIVADHTSSVSGTSISNESFTVTYKVVTPSTQSAGKYLTTITFQVTAIF
jgi:hypothetical protein